MHRNHRKWLSAAAALSIMFSAVNGLLPQTAQPAAAAGQLLAFPGAAGAGSEACCSEEADFSSDACGAAVGGGVGTGVGTAVGTGVG